MPRSKVSLTLLGLSVLTLSPALHAQASRDTANRLIDFSAFGGATGTFTGYHDGKNISVSAGLDIGPGHSFFGFRPAVEVRGMFDIDDGSWVGERAILGGGRVEYPLHNFLAGRFTPNADLLYGRGQLNFVGDKGLNSAGTLLYRSYAGSVLSPGLGFNYDVSRSWAFHADSQFQRYDAMPINATHPHAIATTFGATYYFFRNEKRIHNYRMK